MSSSDKPRSSGAALEKPNARSYLKFIEIVQTKDDDGLNSGTGSDDKEKDKDV